MSTIANSWECTFTLQDKSFLMIFSECIIRIVVERKLCHVLFPYLHANMNGFIDHLRYYRQSYCSLINNKFDNTHIYVMRGCDIHASKTLYNFYSSKILSGYEFSKNLVEICEKNDGPLLKFSYTKATTAIRWSYKNICA